MVMKLQREILQELILQETKGLLAQTRREV